MDKKAAWKMPPSRQHINYRPQALSLPDLLGGKKALRLNRCLLLLKTHSQRLPRGERHVGSQQPRQAGPRGSVDTQAETSCRPSAELQGRCLQLPKQLLPPVALLGASPAPFPVLAGECAPARDRTLYSGIDKVTSFADEDGRFKS